MNEAPTTQPSLLIRLRDQGDERAWAEFTEIYGPAVASTCAATRASGCRRARPGSGCLPRGRPGD